MNKKALLALIVGGVAVAGAMGFYYWNEKVRPVAEKAKQQQAAQTKSCKVHQAARAGDLALLSRMFDAGCSMNGRDDFGMTPLHLAANDRVAEFLIKDGAYIDAKDGRGYTPLRVMEMAGRQDVIDLLKRHGAKR
jgi:hypothetical protein